MLDKINFTIGTITMNAGKDIPGSILEYNLKNQFKKFKTIVVVDGNLTDQAIEFYKNFSNVIYIDSEWTGDERSYRNQYEKIWFGNKNKKGKGLEWDGIPNNEWFGFLDDDEMWSNELIDKVLSKKIDECSFVDPSGQNIKGKFIDLIYVPCILHLTEDGKHYYPAEPKPKEKYVNQWTKQIIVRKGENVGLRHFGSHVQFILKNENPKVWYTKHHYLHMKTLESFVYNDVWQAFLNPQGQGYSPEEAVKFKMFTSCYKTTKEFKDATKKGTWPPPLKKFAWDHRLDYNRPISRLAWVYYILEGNLMPEKDESMDWSNVKNYVLSPDSFKIYEKHKKENNGLHLGE